MPRAIKKAEIDKNKEVFSRKEVCIILGVSMNTLEKMIKLEQVKAIKIGVCRYIIPKWSLDALLNPQEEGGI